MTRMSPKSRAKGRAQSIADYKMQKVMHEFKSGTLKSSSGQPVTNRKQAIAIGISEGKRYGRRRKRV